MSATKKTRKQSTETLASLIRLLSARGYITVRQIAKQMKCSTVVTYKRLFALRKRGCKLEVSLIQRQDGWKGPSPTGFRVVANRASKKILTEAAELR